MNLSDLRAMRTLRRLLPTPVHQNTGGRVALEGHLEYGPSGRQYAPVSGADCAWYHVRLIREPTRQFAKGDDPDEDVLLDFTSPGGFALADRSGRVAVDPAILGYPYFKESRVPESVQIVHRRASPRTLPPVVPREYVDDLRKSERLTLTEIRVSRGPRVFALGRMSSGTLKKSRAGLTVFSTDSRDQVIAKRREDIAIGARMVAGCVLAGLVLAGGGAAYLMSLA
ncbi:hypothetical protein KOI35_42280 [Actinoplanes bogorensis]|uniref:RING-type E3 ubiquitin transferase n=1 Tax=Paractinoplanes bogorensis TaxID=1610840 RepID=A0ABS5Z372_9ACTN|nr:hypothetical protein [Actinoplanes bogorensis]MBU2670150.1 hypothetical protein [Actinoplanes bogorensis]